jgi:rod shape-determining protein MreB
MNYTFDIVVDTRAIYIRVKSGEHSIYNVGFTPSGVELTLELVKYLSDNHFTLISRIHAEKLILEMGSAYPTGRNLSREIMGRDLFDEEVKPKKITITGQDVQNAIINTINEIVSMIQLNVKALAARELDIALSESHFVLKGDFAQLDGLHQRLSEALGVCLTSDLISSI